MDVGCWLRLPGMRENSLMRSVNTSAVLTTRLNCPASRPKSARCRASTGYGAAGVVARDRRESPQR
jgi:hypothetical protein